MPARVVEGLGVGAHGGRAAGVDVVFGDDVVDTAGGVDQFCAGGVEAGAGGVHGGVDALGLLGDLIAVLLVAGGGLVVAAGVGGGDGGGELVKELVVEFGGVFGVHPQGVGAGECLLVGALLVEAAVQVGQLGAGGLFGGPAGCAQDGVGELLCVLLGGVAAGPQGGNVDVVDESGRGDAAAGQVVDVEAGQVVFDEAVGVVVGVWWWLARDRQAGRCRGRVGRVRYRQPVFRPVRRGGGCRGRWWRRGG